MVRDSTYSYHFYGEKIINLEPYCLPNGPVVLYFIERPIRFFTILSDHPMDSLIQHICMLTNQFVTIWPWPCGSLLAWATVFGSSLSWVTRHGFILYLSLTECQTTQWFWIFAATIQPDTSDKADSGYLHRLLLTNQTNWLVDQPNELQLMCLQPQSCFCIFTSSQVLLPMLDLLPQRFGFMYDHAITTFTQPINCSDQ